MPTLEEIFAAIAEAGWTVINAGMRPGDPRARWVCQIADAAPAPSDRDIFCGMGPTLGEAAFDALKRAGFAL